MFGGIPKGFGTHHNWLTHPSGSRILHNAHALIFLRMRLHMCGIQIGWFVVIRVGSGGALHRWRPPLTHTNLLLGLGSHYCVESARLWSLVLGF